jgi:hypothetical protein
MTAMRGFGSLGSMLPMGGDSVWGTPGGGAPDDTGEMPPPTCPRPGDLVSFRAGSVERDEIGVASKRGDRATKKASAAWAAEADALGSGAGIAAAAGARGSGAGSSGAAEDAALLDEDGTVLEPGETLEPIPTRESVAPLWTVPGSYLNSPEPFVRRSERDSLASRNHSADSYHRFLMPGVAPKYTARLASRHKLSYGFDPSPSQQQSVQGEEGTEAHRPRGGGDNAGDVQSPPRAASSRSNPYTMTLPGHSKMKIYSFVGTGLPTERGYVYRRSPPSPTRGFVPFELDMEYTDDTCAVQRPPSGAVDPAQQHGGTKAEAGTHGPDGDDGDADGHGDGDGDGESGSKSAESKGPGGDSAQQNQKPAEAAPEKEQEARQRTADDLPEHVNPLLAGAVRHGVRYANGDATVPMLSLAGVPLALWGGANGTAGPFAKTHNPNGVQSIVREYAHRESSLFEEMTSAGFMSFDRVLRGALHSADHVDMMGNAEVITDVLRIATGLGEAQVSERVSATTARMAAKLTERLEAERDRRTREKSKQGGHAG